MLSFSSLLFSDAFFWMLRVSPITGSFPQPLSAQQWYKSMDSSMIYQLPPEVVTRICVLSGFKQCA